MWLGWSSRVLFPDAKTDESLSNVSFPSGAGYSRDAAVAISSCSASRSVEAVARREVALRRGHRAGHRAAEPEAAAERLAHVPHLLQVLPDEALAHRRVVRRKRRRRAPSGPHGRDRRLGREPPRLDRVVDALERRHVHEPGAVAAQQHARRESSRGSATKPPSGIVFAPHSTRSPPSRMRCTSGCLFSSCSRSCTDSSASR